MNNEQQIDKKFEEIEGEINAEEKFKPISLSNLMSKVFEEAAWLVDKLVPLGGTTALSAAPSSYKTWLALDLAIKVAMGEPLFGNFPTKQSGVLIIDEESGERLLQDRLKKMCNNFDLPIYVISLSSFKLNTEMVAKIVEVCQENKIGAIIFDSLIRIHGADENDATKMAGVFKHLKEINKNGLTVLFTHHNRKQGAFKSDPSQSMRGSSDILASVDCHLAIDRKAREESISIKQTKNRLEKEIQPFRLGIVNDENGFRFDYLGEVDEVQNKTEDCQEMIREVLEKEIKPMFKKELFQHLKSLGAKIGESTFKNALKEMIKEGEVIETMGEKNKTYCSLKPTDEIL